MAKKEEKVKETKKTGRRKEISQRDQVIFCKKEGNRNFI